MTHGHGGYVQGCRCAVCVDARRAYARAWRNGTYQPKTVDAAPYREIVLAVWRETRQSIAWIAGQAHLSPDTVRRLMDGHTERIWITTAAGVRTLTTLLPSTRGGDA